MARGCNHISEQSMSDINGQDLFDLYLKNLRDYRKNEVYKWNALVCFQQNWDLDAPDLADMIKRSCAKTENLLVGQRWYPLGMLREFAEDDPESVRAALRNLIDGDADLKSRLIDFSSTMDTLLARHNEVALLAGRGQAKNHFQDTRSMSVYLALAHPDRYFLYKTAVYRSFAASMGESIPSNKYDKMVEYQHLCNRVLRALQTSYSSIITASDSLLNDEQRAADPEHHLLVQDIAYFSQGWNPEESRPASDDTDSPANPSPDEADTYTREDFLDDVYMGEDRYDELVALLRRKHNVILQGAPGTGKTYAARRLAWSLMGERDESRIGFVQFHQSYSYEDFVIGFRPDGEGGFEARAGTFLSFCRRAAMDPGRDWFFLIDEINRGNVSRVFGEMLMLIEGDHRGEEISLSLDGTRATVPPNVYVIGMMNTADRSLALIDYALRRRFGFFEMVPAFGDPHFARDLAATQSAKLVALADAVDRLNGRIAKDPVLGPGFEIGHSYFHVDEGEDGDLVARSIVEYDLAPTLHEYWYDDSERADREISLLRDAIK